MAREQLLPINSGILIGFALALQPATPCEQETLLSNHAKSAVIQTRKCTMKITQGRWTFAGVALNIT
jgi:hypothetical protein